MEQTAPANHIIIISIVIIISIIIIANIITSVTDIIMTAATLMLHPTYCLAAGAELKGNAVVGLRKIYIARDLHSVGSPLL